MKKREEKVKGYVKGVNEKWMKKKEREIYGDEEKEGNLNIEIRYRYNKDVKRIVEMVNEVIKIILMMIKEMMEVMRVVREKEIG